MHEIIANPRIEKGVTPKQERFCQIYCNNDLSQTDAAILAGYGEKSAHVMASQLLNGRQFPNVLKRIKEIKTALSLANAAQDPDKIIIGPESHHILIRDFIIPCEIGVHQHEKGRKQNVRINLDLKVILPKKPIGDKLGNVFCYEKTVNKIRELTERGHINLVETLAERIADGCLAEPECIEATVTVEKLDVFPDIQSVGVKIIRKQINTKFEPF
jgi:dihydroneopterin aldolase